MRTCREEIRANANVQLAVFYEEDDFGFGVVRLFNKGDKGQDVQHGPTISAEDFFNAIATVKAFSCYRE